MMGDISAGKLAQVDQMFAALRAKSDEVVAELMVELDKHNGDAVKVFNEQMPKMLDCQHHHERARCGGRTTVDGCDARGGEARRPRAADRRGSDGMSVSLKPRRNGPNLSLEVGQTPFPRFVARGVHACRDADPEVFYPLSFANHLSLRTARAFCDACPVRQECAEHSIAHEPGFGIWAGMTPEERREERKKRGLSC